MITRRIKADLDAIKVGRFIYILAIGTGHAALLTTFSNTLTLTLVNIEAHITQSNVRHKAQQLTLREAALCVQTFFAFLNGQHRRQTLLLSCFVYSQIKTCTHPCAVFEFANPTLFSLDFTGSFVQRHNLVSFFLGEVAHFFSRAGLVQR